MVGAFAQKPVRHSASVVACICVQPKRELHIWIHRTHEGRSNHWSFTTLAGTKRRMCARCAARQAAGLSYGGGENAPSGLHGGVHAHGQLLLADDNLSFPDGACHESVIRDNPDTP